jgi:hypothetical protein
METWSCNIKKRGRILRLVLGLLLLGIGIWLLLGSDHDFWATGLCAIGGFSVFEGAVGWCAIRAMGFRTPL